MQDIELKYCLYARKSIKAEEKQVLSIDSQINEMKQITERGNLNVVDITYEKRNFYFFLK